MKLSGITFFVLKLVLFWLTSISNKYAYSQKQEKVDSLKHLIAISEDTSKIDRLRELAMLFVNHRNYNDAFKYARIAFGLGDSLNSDYGRSTGLNLLAICYAVQNRIEEAIKLNKIALNYIGDNNSKKMIDLKVKIVMDMSSFFIMNGKPELAIKALILCYELHKAQENTLGMAVTLSNIGYLYAENFDDDEALTHLLAAKSYLEKVPLTIHYISTNIQIAFIYVKNENFNIALAYSNKVDSLSRLIDYTIGVGQALCLRGEIYLKYYVYDSTHYNGAYESLHAAYKIGQQKNHNHLMANSLSILSELLFHKGDYQRSIQLAKKSIKICEEFNIIPTTLDNYQTLYLSHEALNETEEALKYYKLFTELSDNSRTKNNAQKILKLESKYKIDQKDKNILLLEKNKEIEIKKREISILLYSIVLMIVLITSVLLFKLRKKRYEKELNVLRQLKLEMESSSLENKVTSIPIKFGKKIIPKKLNEIVYFNSEDGYVFLNDTDGKKFVVDNNLKTLEKILPKQFIRVHKSYIINTREIKEITKSYNGKVLFQLHNHSGNQIPSGLKYADNIKKIKELS